MNRKVGLSLVIAAFCASSLSSCSTEAPLEYREFSSTTSSLSAAERRVRAAQIRDAAAAVGLEEGWLLAGIGDAETQLAHCWSELTWACQGLSSPDCGGGPVVAGSGDGPCSIRQGGLGLFQFDAGTFEDTIAREGTRILTIEGNVQAAVDFVTAMVIRSTYISGVDNAAQAIEWMNGVRIDNAQWDAWVRTVTHYYNGCRPSFSCFPSRYERYRDHTIDIYNEMGADFWGEVAGREYVAEYVNQTFPLASMPFELGPGEESLGHLEFRNGGTETWRPGEVFVGTTEPRDADSALAGPDWVSPGRPATVDRVVEPGATGRFEFTLRAPDAPGEYIQYFNFLREGVAWFSSPADNVIQVRVTVTPTDCPAGTSARWSCKDDDTRTRCIAAGVEDETCEFGCLADGMGAVCGSMPIDNDGDGYPRGEDCDDEVASVHPGADDPCGDGLDANCDRNDECGDGGVGSDAGPGGDVGPGGDAGTRENPEISGGCAVGGSSPLSGLPLFAMVVLLWRRRRAASE
ncbi:MAG: hypothetical protein AB8H86_01210 [Polyangiales bacterium]